MSRKRASLAGKGAEILFGAAAEDSAEESLPPEESDTVPAEDSTEASLPLEEQDAAPAEEAGAQEEEPAEDTPVEEVPDWAAGLAEEAATAVAAEEDTFIPPGPVAASGELPEVAPAPLPGESVPVIAAEPELPPLATTPARPAEALPPLATTPAQPAEALPSLATTPAGPAHPAVLEEESVILGLEAEASTPPAPMYTEPVPMPDLAPATLPPPREKPEAYEPALRARIYGAVYDAYTVAPTAKQLEPDGPTSPEVMLPEIDEYEVNQPSRQRDEEAVIRVVSPEQRRFLWDKIFRLYDEVPEALCMDELQDEALQLLQGAQDILMERPRQFDVALYKVSQAESIISRRRNIERWTDTYGWATFVYEMVWIVALAAAILFAPSVVGWVESVVGDMPYFISVGGLWMTAAWGSAGGVLGALYSLYWHTAKVKDFHKQYLMWYVIQPVIGILIGAFVYLITGAGFIGATGENVVTGETSVIPLFRYAIAAIASFRQRFILEVVDRVIQLLTSPFQSRETPEESEQPTTES